MNGLTKSLCIIKLHWNQNKHSKESDDPLSVKLSVLPLEHFLPGDASTGKRQNDRATEFCPHEQ